MYVLLHMALYIRMLKVLILKFSLAQSSTLMRNNVNISIATTF